MARDNMTQDELIARVRKTLAEFELPEPRLPYTEIDGSRLIKTPSGCVREDRLGRLYMNVPKSWLIIGRDEQRAIRRLERESLPRLNFVLHSELEFPGIALSEIKGLRLHKSCRKRCSIRFNAAKMQYELDRDFLFIVSCTTRVDSISRRFKEIGR
jgi:hypothetical protein